MLKITRMANGNSKEESVVVNTLKEAFQSISMKEEEQGIQIDYVNGALIVFAYSKGGADIYRISDSAS